MRLLLRSLGIANSRSLGHEVKHRSERPEQRERSRAASSDAPTNQGSQSVSQSVSHTGPVIKSEVDVRRFVLHSNSWLEVVRDDESCASCEPSGKQPSEVFVAQLRLHKFYL
jgi:hypothetical protein